LASNPWHVKDQLKLTQYEKLHENLDRAASRSYLHAEP